MPNEEDETAAAQDEAVSCYLEVPTEKPKLVSMNPLPPEMISSEREKSSGASDG